MMMRLPRTFPFRAVARECVGHTVLRFELLAKDRLLLVGQKSDDGEGRIFLDREFFDFDRAAQARRQPHRESSQPSTRPMALIAGIASRRKMESTSSTAILILPLAHQSSRGGQKG